jgi:HEAT repeat protein
MKRTHLLLAVLVFALLGAPAAAQGTFLGKPLAKWLGELKDKDPQVRRGAAFALGKFPDHAIRVSQPLLDRIAEDDDAGVRDAAATALGDMTQRNELAVLGIWSKAKPVLRQALAKETDERVLRGVLYAIGSFGPSGADLHVEVQAKLEHKDASIRQNAAWALGRMGEKAADALDALAACLSDEDALVRRDTATALGDIAVQAAAKAQGDPKLSDRLSQRAARPLLALVKSEKDDVVQKTALEKLIKLVRPAKEDEKDSPYKDDSETLSKLLSSKDPELAHVAAFVLAKIGGKEAAPAIPVLCEALRDEEMDVQRTAAASLENLGQLAAPAVRDLSKALRNGTDKEARAHCANALAYIGSEAKAAIPDLVAVVNSDAPIKVRHFAAEALAKVLEGLARKQQYFDNAEVQAEILKVLAKNEPERPASQNEHYTVATMRHKCVACFFFVPELSKEATAVLSNILDEQSDAGLMVRYEAARVLAEQLRDQAPAKAVDWLLHFLRNDQINLYFGTRAEVSGGGTEASTGSPMLKANVGGDARFIAADALGKLGKKAAERKDVIEELKKAASEAKDPRLREEAKKALDKLGAK